MFCHVTEFRHLNDLLAVMKPGRSDRSGTVTVTLMHKMGKNLLLKIFSDVHTKLT